MADDCGLSALAVARREETNDDAVVAAGSESGRITILRLKHSELVQVDSCASHSATVTGNERHEHWSRQQLLIDIVAALVGRRDVDFLSVGLDCRVSVSRFDASKNLVRCQSLYGDRPLLQILLVTTILLNVADPSKICPVRASKDNEYIVSKLSRSDLQHFRYNCIVVGSVIQTVAVPNRPD